VARTGMWGFLFGAAGMFATMYSTQAILPELGREFGVAPSTAGLTVSVLVLSIAAGAWVWGPLSDRIGRRRSLLYSSALLIAPSVGVALAPTFGVLLAFRVLQGLCMPGLLAVGVPYVTEAFTPQIGSRAMGYYVSSLVAGGLLGRVGVALLTAAFGWRIGVGSMAILPLAATVIMSRSLPEVASFESTRVSARALAEHLRNRALILTTVGGSGMFFGFVGVFTYVAYRLEAPPFSYSQEETGLIFLLWLTGVVGPFAGRLAERVGWRAVGLLAVSLGIGGVLLSAPAWLPTLVLGLGMLTVGMFSTATAAQLGVGAVTTHNRGLASALYFSSYYVAGALGAYLPGFAWQAWRWAGVMSVSLGALVVALAAIAAAGPAARRIEARAVAADRT
jgi:MFS transporter, YNFM family, putative membrane transport protein